MFIKITEFMNVQKAYYRPTQKTSTVQVATEKLLNKNNFTPSSGKTNNYDSFLFQKRYCRSPTGGVCTKSDNFKKKVSDEYRKVRTGREKFGYY